MSQQIKIGSIVIGKVTGVQPYGAFVSLNDTAKGLIHISEITNGYVDDINKYVKINDEVKVKVLEIDKNSGKISLSIRALENKEQRSAKGKRYPKHDQLLIEKIESEDGFNTLKDKLQVWLDQSNYENILKS